MLAKPLDTFLLLSARVARRVGPATSERLSRDRSRGALPNDLIASSGPRRLGPVAQFCPRCERASAQAAVESRGRWRACAESSLTPQFVRLFAG